MYKYKAIRETLPIMQEPLLPAWGYWFMAEWISIFIFLPMPSFFCCRRRWQQPHFRHCLCRAAAEQAGAGYDADSRSSRSLSLQNNFFVQQQKCLTRVKTLYNESCLGEYKF